jgi:methylated-DNA-[protein]-cysteine S-methyltransferase
MLQFLGSASDLRGALARLRRAFAPAEDRDALGEIERELRDYLDGEADALSRPVDLCLVRGSFQRAALRQLAGLPVGSVTTYRGLAAAVGAPEAARAIGQAMHDNPVPVYVPCHRVVRSDRTLGGYAAGLAIKIFLLRREGFHIDERRGTIEPALVGSLARKTFCRPGCQAANGATLFFATVSAARRAGLQPCRRCL